MFPFFLSILSSIELNFVPVRVYSTVSLLNVYLLMMTKAASSVNKLFRFSTDNSYGPKVKPNKIRVLRFCYPYNLSRSKVRIMIFLPKEC